MVNRRILITSGSIWVAIDSVRIISNRSSGQLGRILTKQLIKKGAKVHILEGPIEFDDFLKKFKNELKKKYDVVIHAAAVSDYKLKGPFKAKVSSNLKELKLKLVPTPKIINLIKKIHPQVFLVGFKLEQDINEKSAGEKTRPLFEKASCDLVVANSARGKKYQAYILDQEHLLAQASSREELAGKLIKILDQKI